jgi:hypothetical protein
MKMQMRLSASLLPGAERLVRAGVLTREMIGDVMEQLVEAQLRAGGGAAGVGFRAAGERCLAFVFGPWSKDGGGPPEVALVLTPDDVPSLPGNWRGYVEGKMRLPTFFPD